MPAHLNVVMKFSYQFTKAQANLMPREISCYKIVLIIYTILYI